MARRITTHVLCDVCLQEDVDTEGEETPPITIGRMAPRILGLCERHRKEYDTFRELVQELGQPVPEGGPVAPLVRKGKKAAPVAAPGSGVYPCPDPSCRKHSQPYGHVQSLRNHARVVHGKTIPELREAFPDSVDVLATPTPDQADRPRVWSATCPECGKDYTWPEIARPTVALGVHRAKAHGVRGATKKDKG